MPTNSRQATTVNSTVTSRDGTEIAFERTGTGPAVILVSSALADRSEARKLAGLPAEHSTVIGYDRRGRGAGGGAAAYGVEREVEDKVLAHTLPCNAVVMAPKKLTPAPVGFLRG